MKLLRFLLRLFVLPIVDGEGGGTPAAEVSTPAPAPAVESTAPVSAPAVAAPAEPKPTSMLEAISQSMARDERGRFTAAKEAAAAEAAPAAAPAAPGAPAVAAAAPAAPKPGTEDLTAMPEGLGPKAQERFQRLASANREANERVDMLDRQVNYIRETFQQHAVKPEQFEQAASVIGMMNSGNLRGALAVLDQQRAQIALALGEPQPGVDALQQHPDLRQAVDALEITEQRALEVARLRQQTGAQQQRDQAAQQQRDTNEAARREVQTAQGKVDEFCKRMAASDIDYPAIEAQLLPVLPDLMRGIPPAAWTGVIETQYRLLKSAAGSFRRAAPSQHTNPLGATGGASPRQAPSSMHEAMWGTSPRA